MMQASPTYRVTHCVCVLALQPPRVQHENIKARPQLFCVCPGHTRDELWLLLYERIVIIFFLSSIV